jgi:beta-glucosidase
MALSPAARQGSTVWRKVALGLTVALVLSGGAVATPAGAADRPWMNRHLSPDRRASLLLSAMTLEEKVDLMTGDQGEAPTAFYNAPIPRLGIPALRMADASAGIANRGWTLPGTGGRATAMPSGEALAASFNRALGERYAGVVADEARQTGHNVLLGPNADIMRQPYWGRTTETESEDPLLISSFTTPYVREVQQRRVVATLKHFVGNNQETNRNIGQNSIIGERALHEVYARPYADAVQRARLGSVMCSFNKLNGTYACENEPLLTDLLRTQLGFKGFVMTDFGAAHSTVPTITAGTDMETGTDTFFDGALLRAVQDGTVSEALVDRSVLRILRTMFAIGLFDTDYTPTAIPVRQHGAVARKVQDQAVTLLKNADHQLPLRRRVGSVAVIGGDANITAIAGGSARVEPTYQVSPLDGIRARAAEAGATVRYASGNDPVNGASMIETRTMTAVPSSVLTPAQGTGSGLTTQYWGNTTFTGAPALTRVERQVNYDAGFVGGSPAFQFLYASQVPPTPAVSGNPFGADQSARYTGYFTAPKTGTYRLGLTGWGDAQLSLDGRLIADMTGRNGRRSVTSPPLSLVAGQRHALQVNYATNRPLNFLQPGTLLLQWTTPPGAYSPAVQEAMAAARSSDVAVVYVRTYESEERDRVSLKLPQGADQLIRAVRRANPHTVVVLATAGPVTMPWLQGTPAVLQSYFGGQEEGTSLARVLFGDVNPSGRLPLSYPRSENQLPPGIQNPWAGIDNLDVVYREGIHVGYRGYLKAGIRPLFPFGHGLSYTTFRYSKLRVNGAHDTAFVRVRVKNTGRVPGAEVVQVYVGKLPTAVDTPVRALAGFAKVSLRPGQHRDVLVPLSRRALSYWDAAADRWVTPRGTVRVYVGSSSTSIRLTGTLRVR